MGELITVYGERKPFNPKGEEFTLEELQGAVGGPIEFAETPSGKILVVNEEGKLTGFLANIEATKIFLGTNNLDEFPGILNDPYRRINGDAVLCDPKEIS